MSTVRQDSYEKKVEIEHDEGYTTDPVHVEHAQHLRNVGKLPKLGLTNSTHWQMR
jgi:hypothetical protein